jgi:hypothetical protein
MIEVARLIKFMMFMNGDKSWFQMGRVGKEWGGFLNRSSEILKT